MTVFVALLRAVNVGGTCKLPMTVLKDVCEDAGFTKVRTYIASGNVVFESRLNEAKVRASLAKRLHAYAGKPVGVVVRTAAEMRAVLAANPFPERATNGTVAIFLDEAPAADTIETALGRRDEEIALGIREIYVFYGAGMGTSKLRFPKSMSGTARNLNTVAKLVEMSCS